MDTDRGHRGTLIMVLFNDLVPEQDVTMPTPPEQRAPQWLERMHTRRKTAALCIDAAHDRHSRTLLGLKRLMELVHARGETLSVVLAGHLTLASDLRRPAMEESSSRATVSLRVGVKGPQRAYITWLLEPCAPAQTREDMLTDPALALLADHLTAPLQIERYVTRALEKGQKIGQTPLTPEVIESVLAWDLDDLEPRLTRHGYHVKALADRLHVRPTDIRAFLAGGAATQPHAGIAAGTPCSWAPAVSR